jgi:ABC-type nitrate/sulfonate/bicarbonate transport system permease component
VTAADLPASAVPATPTPDRGPTRGRRGGGITLRWAVAGGLAVALPVVLVIVWWYASASSLNPYYPPLKNIYEAFGPTWLHGRVVHDILPSLARLAVGWGLAVLLGVALGVPVGSSRRVRAFCEPVLEFLRAIPPPILVPVFILVTGIGNTMKILVIVSGCVWPVLLNTVEGVRATDEVLADTCRSYGITGPARLWHLVIRSASPQIVTGMRQALSIGIILMVISEMTAASNGLGFTVVQFQRSFELTAMWTGIVVLGVLGVLLAGLMRLFERYALRWYFGVRQSQRDR